MTASDSVSDAQISENAAPPPTEAPPPTPVQATPVSAAAAPSSAALPVGPAAAPSSVAPPPIASSLVGRVIRPYAAEWATGAALGIAWLLAITAFVIEWSAISSTGANKDMTLDGVNEFHLLALITAAGALGAMIHALTSFATYVGNGTFDARWSLWYISRPAVGATLALCILPLLRAGFIDNGGAFSKSENATFTVVSLAILVGMFSKDATDKMADIFSTFLSSNRNASRDGKLNTLPPVLDSLTPAAVSVGTAQLRILVSGQNFSESTRVMVNGLPRKTSYNGADQLVFWLSQDDVASRGSLSVSACSQDPNSRQESAPLPLIVESPSTTASH